jgi:hypothetical protein
MKLLVRILAEAEGPIQNKEVVKIENVFVKHIVKAMLKELKDMSPVSDRSALPEKLWTRGRIEKDRRLKEEWAVGKGDTTGGKSIYNRMPYTKFLLHGTGIFGPRGTPIRPTEKKALAFYSSFMKRWVVTREVKGINPARFQKIVDDSQFIGTIIGARNAEAEMERTWRGILQTKLIRL